MFAELVSATSSGTALIAWALFLGCGPLEVAMLGALPQLSQLVHVPSAWITSYFGPRRVALVAVGASRQALLPLVAIPFLPLSPEARRACLLVVGVVSALLAGVGNQAWTLWMGDLVPKAIRGRYFGRRTAICTLVSSTAVLITGQVLDRAKHGPHPEVILASLAAFACLCGAVTTCLMWLQHDPKPRAERELPSLRAALAPLQVESGRRLLLYQVTWNAAVGLASTLVSLHMIQNLKMGYGLVATYAAMVALARVAAAPHWGRAIDTFGAKPVLVVCSLGIASVPAIWLFPTPERLWPIALEALISGTLWSGHALAIFTLPLATAPKDRRPFHIAAFTSSGGLAFAAAAALAGTLAELLPARLELGGHTLFNLHVMFALSACARLSAALLTLRLVEPRAKAPQVLLRSVALRARALMPL